MKNKLQRYSLHVDGDDCGNIFECDVIKDSQGDYIKYDDYAKLKSHPTLTDAQAQGIANELEIICKIDPVNMEYIRFTASEIKQIFNKVMEGK